MGKQLLGKIPCKDCITISTCIALVSNADMTKPTDVISTVYKLVWKCSLIKKYMKVKDQDLLFEIFDEPHSTYIQKTLRYLDPKDKGYKHED